MTDLYKADKILENIFIFDEDGDMEKSTVEVPNVPLDWDFSANDDQERTFMLNRFTFLDLLSRARLSSSDDKYVKKGISLINDWIDNVKLEPSKKTRTLDTGMRIYHFIDFVLKNDIDGGQKEKIDKSIYDQIIYLRDNYIEKYDLSNWGLVQVIAIAIAGIYFENKKMYEQALRKLETMLEIQYIDHKSIHWEKCLGYHNFMLLWLLRLAKYERDYGYEYSFKEEIKNIASTTYVTRDLDGNQINNGDSDLINVNYLLEMYEDIFKEKIETLDQRFFKNYGLYVEKKSNSMLSCYNQSMSSNHTHADFTHFNYQKDDLRIRDGGRYTYVESAERKYFKLYAHNNLLVDDTLSMAYATSWDTDYYPVINPIYVDKQRHTFVEMSYFDDRRALFIKRRLFYLEDGDLLVFDHAFIKGKHEAKTSFLVDDIYDKHIKSNKNISYGDAKYSTDYNKLKDCKEAIIKEEFQDIYTQCMIFGDADKYEFVDISRNKTKLSDTQGLAVKKGDDIFVNIFEEITDSPRVFTVEDFKFHARAITLNKEKGLEIYR